MKLQIPLGLRLQKQYYTIFFHRCLRSTLKKRNANDVLIDLARNFFFWVLEREQKKHSGEKNCATSLLFDAYRVIIFNVYFRVIGSLFKWCHEFMFSHTHFFWLLLCWLVFRVSIEHIRLGSYMLFYASNNRIPKHSHPAHTRLSWKCEPKSAHWVVVIADFSHAVCSWHKLLIVLVCFFVVSLLGLNSCFWAVLQLATA